MKTANPFFWDVYARCYDWLLETLPYTRLLNRVVACAPGTARSLLDAGCGTGNLLRVLKQRNPVLRAEGFDYSSAMLARAQIKLPGTRLIRADLNEALPYPSNTFDVVTCVNAINVATDIRASLRELLRVLKSGGTLVITSPLANARIRPLIEQIIAELGWIQTLRLIGRFIPILLLNLLITHQAARRKCHYMELSTVRRLFGDAPVSLAYADQNWFVCLTKDKDTESEERASMGESLMSAKGGLTCQSQN